MRQIEAFKIGRFRGLEDVTFDGFGDLNLIVGGNNSGKTSVLEALAVYAAPTDILEWAAIARTREVRAVMIGGSGGLSSSDAIRWLFHQDSPDWSRGAGKLNLAASGAAQVASIDAICEPIRGMPPEPRYKTVGSHRRAAEEQQIEEDGWHLSIQVALNRPISQSSEEQLGLNLARAGLNDDRRNLSLDLELWSSSSLVRHSRARGLSIRTASLSPYSHRNQPLQMRALSDVISSGQKDEVLSMLRGIDPNFVDLEIITGSGDRPLLTAQFGSGRRVPVTVLGDGFRRALAIALALNKARGGILLIDEIEAAMHVSALDRLFPWLLRSARDRNVQVFATTHSLEAIQEITSSVAKVDPEVLSAFHLPGRRSSNPVLRRYSGGMLKRLVQERGLDIR